MINIFYITFHKVSNVFNFPFELALALFPPKCGFLKTKVILKILKIFIKISYICHLLIKLCLLHGNNYFVQIVHVTLLKILRLFTVFSIFFKKKKDVTDLYAHD